MKAIVERTVKRDAKLPALAFDLASLDALVSDLSRHCGGAIMRVSIELKGKGETLKFSSVQEVREYERLPSSVRTFDVDVSCGGDYGFRNGVHFVAGGGWGRPWVWSIGPDEGWCAGAIEIVRGFGQRHKRWYAPLTPMLLWAVLIGASVIPMVLEKILGRQILTGRAGIAYTAALLALAILTFGNERLLPPVQMYLNLKESWLRRHASEVSVIAAVIAAIAAVLALFFRT